MISRSPPLDKVLVQSSILFLNYGIENLARAAVSHVLTFRERVYIHDMTRSLGQVLQQQH